MNRRRYNQPNLSPYYVDPYWDPYWYGPPDPYHRGPHYYPPPPPPWRNPNQPAWRGAPRGYTRRTNGSQIKNASRRSDRGVIYNVDAQKKLDKAIHIETKSIKRKAKQHNGVQVVKRDEELQITNEETEKKAILTNAVRTEMDVKMDNELPITKKVKEDSNQSEIRVIVAKRNEPLEVDELKMTKEILEEMVTKVVEAEEMKAVRPEEEIRITEEILKEMVTKVVKADKMETVIREDELRITQEILDEMVTKVVEAEKMEVVIREDELRIHVIEEILEEMVTKVVEAEEMEAVMREDELRIHVIEEILEEMLTKMLEAEKMEAVMRKDELRITQEILGEMVTKVVEAEKMKVVMREEELRITEEILEEILTKVMEAEVIRGQDLEKDDDTVLHWVIHMCSFSISERVKSDDQSLETDIELVQEYIEKVEGKEKEEEEEENVHWAISLLSFD